MKRVLSSRLALVAVFILTFGVLAVQTPRASALTTPDGYAYAVCGRAFGNFVWLTGAVVPSGVTGIGSHAFYQCGGLTFVTLPAALTEISNGLFSGWGQLAGSTHHGC